ncbi:MAG: anaerobic ribonucleoside-triphosphate reductase activating protein [Verrucomicrobiota bacterium]|nr:anaerobic ribonucleoside-triphosphate reductase activating protein [Verrucomicrobiota bacterium]
MNGAKRASSEFLELSCGQPRPSAGTSPVYAFLRKPSLVDFAGHLAGVFFLSGCNFRCGFCHNPDLMRRKQNGIPWDRLESACLRFADEWVDGAVITGGEPTLEESLPDLIGFFKRFGWAVKLDTNGSRPDRLKQCLPLFDYVAMDIKAGPSKYPELCGFGDVAAIRESANLIKAGARDYEFRTTVIASFHSDEQMLEIGELIRGARRYVLQPFVPKERVAEPEFRSLLRAPEARLFAIRDLLAGCASEVIARGDA